MRPTRTRADRYPGVPLAVLSLWRFYLSGGATVAFAESSETLARNMVAVRPTLMTAVPRVFEKMHARIEQTVAQASRIRQAIFRWAIHIGLQRSERQRSGWPVGLLLAAQHRLADRLVFRTLRAATGGRLRVLVSGSAPLPRAIASFFDAIGLTICEGYGLTEASPVLTVNPLDRPKVGTVGRPLPGVELRIADDGEILARGPNIMMGYYHDAEATRAALDSNVNAARAPFEQIKRFALIPSEFTTATGEMTPTMKVKRRVVEQRWRALIDTLYEETEQPVARRLP